MCAACKPKNNIIMYSSVRSIIISVFFKHAPRANLRIILLLLSLKCWWAMGVGY